MSLLVEYPNIASVWHPTKNGELTPDKITSGSHKKVWWKCPIADDHEFEAVIKNMTRQSKKPHNNICPCSCCAGNKVVKSNCLATTHPKIASQWHPTKNGNSTPYNVIFGSNSKVWWFCDKGHEWDATINSRDRNGCPFCGGKRVTENNSLVNYSNAIKLWHTKNTLKPSEVHAHSNKKYWWKCPIADDHEWQATPANIINNKSYGCPYCSNHKLVLSNCLAVAYPNVAKEWHPTKNGKLTPLNVISGGHTKYWWKCPIADDHEWQASVDKRGKYNRGCPCCHGLKIVKSNCLATTNPEIAKQFHTTKNGFITAWDVMEGGKSKVWWLCDKGHEWKAVLANRRLAGCPICKELRGEKAIASVLNKYGIEHDRQWTFSDCKYKKVLQFDFRILTDEKEYLIEYQGEQHYKPIDFFGGEEEFRTSQVRDEIKKVYCKNKKELSMIAIPYWDYDNIEEILVKFLNLKRETNE